MNQSNFNYESDVIATNLELRNSRYLKQWQVYSVKISGVKPGCSSTTFYQSSSSVFGNTITTTTKPVSGQVCYKGHGLSDEEMEKYKLIKAAEIAFEKNAKTFFRLGQEFWIPLDGEESYEELQRFFVPNAGESQEVMRTKARRLKLSNIPYKIKELKTSNEYYYNTQTNQSFNKDELVMRIAHDMRFKSNVNRKDIKTMDKKAYLEMYRPKDFTDEASIKLQSLIDEGIVIVKNYDEKAFIPNFPKKLIVNEVLKDKSNKLKVNQE